VCGRILTVNSAGGSDARTRVRQSFLLLWRNHRDLFVSGCTRISCISVTPGPEPPRRLLLQYLDLTDCHAVEDGGLRVIVRNCPQLAYLYLRRCVQITGEPQSFNKRFYRVGPSSSAFDFYSVGARFESRPTQRLSSPRIIVFSSVSSGGACLILSHRCVFPPTFQSIINSFIL
jgi:hypothetical protein